MLTDEAIVEGEFEGLPAAQLLDAKDEECRGETDGDRRTRLASQPARTTFLSSRHHDFHNRGSRDETR